MKNLIIATRGSQLALWQSEFIKDKLQKQYPDMSVSLKILKTKGDKILDTPLAKIGGKGLFTKELEMAMLNGEAHIAVHSLKDVPMEFPEGLDLICVSKREDRSDAFLSDKYACLEDLPPNATIGTTSLRRRMQILELRSDLNIKNLRGNINTRLAKLKDGQYDAIILATAGIKRLGLENEVKYFSPLNTIPAAAQAILGIEGINSQEIKNLLAFINDEHAYIESTIERDFVRILEGGCQVPIGVSAKINGDEVSVDAIIGMPDASRIIKKSLQAKKSEYKLLGEKMANLMLENDARAILKAAEEMALNAIL